MVVQDNGHDIAINMDMVPANEDEIADQDEDDESLGVLTLNPRDYPESYSKISAA